MAWEVLAECRLSEKTAFQVLLESITAAHRCASSIDQISQTLVRDRARENVNHSFKRLANCIKRSPAPVRRTLDAKFAAVVNQKITDSEFVATILEGIETAFHQHPNSEPAQTALKVLARYSVATESGTYKPPIALLDDYLAMPAKIREVVESKLAKVMGNRRRRPTALRLASSISSATANKSSKRRSSRGIGRANSRRLAIPCD